jgi:hypothetical protein
VSFDLGVLDHFRVLEQRRITATVHYDPQSATCTPSVQTIINGQVAALEPTFKGGYKLEVNFGEKCQQ